MTKTRTERTPPFAVSPTTAAELLDISRSQVYRLLQSGDLEAVKIGRSNRIKVDSIHRLAAEGTHA